MKKYIGTALCFILISAYGCSLSVDQTELDFGTTEVTQELTLTIKGNVQWEMNCDADWVIINPDHGPSNRQLTLKETIQPVQVSVNRDGLEEGVYEATLTISNNRNLPCPDIVVRMSVVTESLPSVVEGHVYDAETSGTLFGVVVSLDAGSYTTGDDGYYLLMALSDGLKTINASKAGYEDYHLVINLENGATQHDIYLIPVGGVTTTISSTTSTSVPGTTTTVPVGRFTINGDGTVTDNDTGLVWLRDANCSLFHAPRDWYDATDILAPQLEDGYCGLADNSQPGDWRLPTKAEWENFVCTEYTDPAVCDTEGTGKWSEGNPFYHVQSFYWSSTTADRAFEAWGVDMYIGSMGYDDKGNGYYVWPVRE